MASIEHSGPLRGIRVIEAGHTVMGPCCSMVLADLGADVIKIEPPEGDRTRGNIGFGSALFPVFNRNKRSVVIDLKGDSGRTVLMRLLGGADALIENFAHGAMERLDLGYEALSTSFPRLVYCSLKGFLPGPYEKRGALDEIVQYMGGLAHMTGPPGQPLRAGSSVVDILGGTFGALAIVAALRERDITGLGQKVQSGLFESTALLMAQHMGQQALTGEPPPPMPQKVSSWAIYQAFQTADDKTVFVGITSDNHWRNFCMEFGLHDLLENPNLRTNPQRAQARHEILPIVTEKISGERFDSLMEKLERLRIPFGPLSTPGDLFDDRHLNESGRLLAVDMKAGVSAKIPSLPINMDNRKPQLYRQPPAAGQHTREVLQEAGYSLEEIGTLLDQGAIRTSIAVP